MTDNYEDKAQDNVRNDGEESSSTTEPQSVYGIGPEPIAAAPTVRPEAVGEPESVRPPAPRTPADRERLSEPDRGNSESVTRDALEANIRRTYAPTARPEQSVVSDRTEAADYREQPGEMKYGAIKSFQVVPEEKRKDGSAIYGLGYDGGVYLWDKERKAWVLVNK